MSYIDLTQLSTEDKRALERQLIPPLSEQKAILIQDHVIELLSLGEFTADVVRFSTEALVHVCVGLLNPIMKPNSCTPDQSE